MDSIVQTIINEKIIVIFRRLYDDQLLKTVESLYKGGVRCVEVTFDQSDPDCVKKTGDSIRLLNHYFPNMTVGAGTVITIEQLLSAYDAKAKYIISPNTDQEIITKTKELGLVSIPGATTPSEILNAHKYGADIVKIFPSNSLGLSYVKDLIGPINHVKFVVAAGITLDNITDYLDIGCVGFGISGPLTDKELINKKDFLELEQRASKFVNILRNHKDYNFGK
jgi:2-dehydro-3-deoxyphosphogluconate aldolase / (4S)-4-hydroxy-2-oxoglutarate aldolase